MTEITPNYLELKAGDMTVTKRFYTEALGFAFTDYGPDYAANENAPMMIGFAAGEAPVQPLPAFQSSNLEETLAAVKAAGGTIIKDVFSYPGGRRFQFLDPSDNEIAIFQADDN